MFLFTDAQDAPECSFNELRVIDTTDLPSGRPQRCINGRFQSFCEGCLDDISAAVICRTLNLNPEG